MVKSLVQTENLVPTPSSEDIKKAEQVGANLLERKPRVNNNNNKRITSANMINGWSGGEVVLGDTDWFETEVKFRIQQGQPLNLKATKVNRIDNTRKA